MALLECEGFLFVESVRIWIRQGVEERAVNYNEDHRACWFFRFAMLFQWLISCRIHSSLPPVRWV